MPPNVGEVRKALARREPGRPQPRGAGVEHGVDLRRERRVLDRDPPVALDEGDDDVLAAQPGQQVGAGRVAERVVARRPCANACWSCDAGAHLAHLVVGEAGRARRGDRRARRRPARRATAHSDPDDRRAPRPPGPTRPGAGRTSRVSRSTASGMQDEHGDDEQRRPRPRTTIAPGRPTESPSRPTAGAEVAPVDDRVERPVERREEAHVEDLHDGQQAEQHADEQRPRPVSPAAAGRARARRASSPSTGMRTNARGVRSATWFGATQGEPDEQARPGP